ncbi:Uncharacterised protein [Burkholderia pseudomallei]|nr:Uncharacterised protein [Burkholderia pseudomallei]CAJ3731674.1 Uncharacterised protein [Burkholderia pseudomallei]CAJ3868205.1 Uncharacterised protein [Burkholderia pseudomallei]CAJ4885008.1 Uncharacterised protein [Burkholderia pseudomallei]CAJ4991268.1 Uncharacterised protein [Burkholderia pseudomallei]
MSRGARGPLLPRRAASVFVAPMRRCADASMCRCRRSRADRPAARPHSPSPAAPSTEGSRPGHGRERVCGEESIGESADRSETCPRLSPPYADIRPRATECAARRTRKDSVLRPSSLNTRKACGAWRAAARARGGRSRATRRAPRAGRRAPGVERRALSVEHRTPSTEYRVPSTEHRAPSIEHRASSIENRGAENRGPTAENRRRPSRSRAAIRPVDRTRRRASPARDSAPRRATRRRSAAPG